MDKKIFISIVAVAIMVTCPFIAIQSGSDAEQIVVPAPDEIKSFSYYMNDSDYMNTFMESTGLFSNLSLFCENYFQFYQHYGGHYADDKFKYELLRLNPTGFEWSNMSFEEALVIYSTNPWDVKESYSDVNGDPIEVQKKYTSNGFKGSQYFVSDFDYESSVIVNSSYPDVIISDDLDSDDLVDKLKKMYDGKSVHGYVVVGKNEDAELKLADENYPAQTVQMSGHVETFINVYNEYVYCITQEEDSNGELKDVYSLSQYVNNVDTSRLSTIHIRYNEVEFDYYVKLTAVQYELDIPYKNGSKKTLIIDMRKDEWIIVDGVKYIHKFPKSLYYRL